MDYTAMLKKLLTAENVSEISKQSNTTADEVSRVINAAIPLFEENGAQAAEAKLTRAAESGTSRSILGTLLGTGATSLIAQNSGVSQKKTNSILSLVAPLLLSGMLGTSQNASSNSGLTSLLGSLLGAGTAQTQTAQTAGNAGTLSLLASLMGTASSAQTQQTSAASGTDLLSSLLGGLGSMQTAQTTQTAAQAANTINLLGNAAASTQTASNQSANQSSGGLLSALLNLVSTDTSND
mgnify:CR=1 FL=1